MENNSKKDFWFHHIQECTKSCLSQVEYCTTNKIPLSTFGYWKRKLRENQNSKPVFYPLTVSSAPTIKNSPNGSGLTLHFKDRRFSIEIENGFSEATLSQVVATIEQL